MHQPTAFLFPGQGSQSVGMMAALAEDHEAVAGTFAEASRALGYDLWAVASEGPEERLNRTEVTQPAMLVADLATWRLWLQAGGPEPDYLAGHSLGEYAALVAAEALEFGDAVALVAERGRLMQEATPPGTGAMAAVLGLDDAVLQQICLEAAGDEVVACANFNAPGQVVIAGHAGAVERTCEAAKAAGAHRIVPLPVSVPSHCLLMKGAADALGKTLAGARVAPPRIPVVHNVDVAARENPDDIREALVAQLWQPVRWTATIEYLSSRGVTRFAECGPGKVLTGLNRRIDRALACTPLVDSETLNGAVRHWRENED